MHWINLIYQTSQRRLAHHKHAQHTISKILCTGYSIICLPSWRRGWLGAVALCHCPVSRESTYHTSLAWDKINIWSLASTECLLLSYHLKLKTCKHTTVNRRTSVLKKRRKPGPQRLIPNIKSHWVQVVCPYPSCFPKAKVKNITKPNRRPWTL